METLVIRGLNHLSEPGVSVTLTLCKPSSQSVPNSRYANG